MTITYTAIDGKNFNNKEACEKYEASLKRREIFKVVNSCNSYECFIVKKDERETLYIEHWDGNHREGGCTFNGTLKEFLRKQFR